MRAPGTPCNLEEFYSKSSLLPPHHVQLHQATLPPLSEFVYSTQNAIQ